ncbi:ATP-binding cassette domain-containing protein [Streptomyces sp. TRM66268-LWL]|uniref:ATP-binding cassette domain-containing protein n=1 Tax=Streptomyces polyasparticus TaxID=2767826 RepID=A0ABR7SDP7_9ACTN|nr:ATP-binding cassette domain-containing protein [Streptomyces polyasparticus]MBC9712840.1 ATP-binding cassette domain-containing protein [Streptomyces polyasparticus]
MIEVRELSKRYGTTTAVRALSFTVRPGHVTGFLGPNGAGKTTTLRMLLGLNTPTAGTATIDGRDFGAVDRGLRHVGALLDAQDVHGGRTARAHLSAVAASNGIPRGRVRDVLDEVGLADVAGRRIGGFSLGMKQRLGIAGALLGDPPVLIFDEPLNGLDPEGVQWLRALLRRLAAEGRTVFVSSHQMSEMELCAEQLIVIGRGELIAAESLTEFAARGTRQGVRVRARAAERLARALRAEGAEVLSGEEALTVTGMDAERIGDLALLYEVALAELTPLTASLEQAFMELTADSVDYATTPRTGEETR